MIISSTSCAIHNTHDYILYELDVPSSEEKLELPSRKFLPQFTQESIKIVNSCASLEYGESRIIKREMTVREIRDILYAMNCVF